MKKISRKITVLALAAGMALVAGGCNLNPTPSGPPDSSSSHEESVTEPSSREEASLPDPETPDGVAFLFLESVKALDPEEIRPFLSEPEQFRFGSLDSANPQEKLMLDLGRQYLDRMEYVIGDADVSGDTATVSVAFTVPNLGGVMTDLMADIVKQTAMAALAGKEVDVEAYLMSYLGEKIDIAGLESVTVTAPVELIRDPEQGWLIDTAAGSNEPMLNAMSGGLLDQLKGLEQYTK